MTKKEYLSQARVLHSKIESHLKIIEEYRIMSNSIPSPSFDQEIVDKTRNLDAPFVKWLYKIDEWEIKVKEEQQQLEALVKEIAEVINNVDNPTYQAVLAMRYVCFLSWEDIASKLGYCEDSIYKFHRKALEEIEI